MGVPAFFRWLSKKYVSIIVDAVEEKNRDVDGNRMPVDSTKPNPNFQEFDNLYLDMNGIIHPCTHPEDRPAPKTEDEMFVLIFEYIDRLFSIVRPRRVLYMAIDGVAPRAKMNQQRSRRFRAVKEAEEKKEQILSVRKKLSEEGVPLPPARKEEEHFDSNCITPGTPFMDRLAVALRYYVHQKIASDPAWQSIQVILSDANAPGEGEHKVMDFIRKQRASPSHDPNTVHCLCGADADLIMLGLATHEPNFNILREEFVPNQPRACDLCGQYGHELQNCQGLAREEAGPDQADPLKKEKNFIFIRLPVLREYLEHELKMPNLPFEYDFERAIDDWVFMCFFVGNDFLPHLPSLEIRENAIDRLIKLYKNVVYDVKGWLTHNGDVHMDRVQMIMTELGKVEDEIFKTRQIKEVRYRENNKQRRRREKAGNNTPNAYGQSFIPERVPYVPFQATHTPYQPQSYGNYGNYTPRYGGNYSVPPPPIPPGGGYGAPPYQMRNVRPPMRNPGSYSAPPPLHSQQNSYSSNYAPRNQYSSQYNTPRGASGGGNYGRGGAYIPHNASLIAPLSSAPSYMSGSETRKRAADDRIELQRCADASERLKAMLAPTGTKRHAEESAAQEPPTKSFKDATGNRSAKNGEKNGSESEEEEEPKDDIRLWEDGWKDRYYKTKFGVSESDAEFRRKVAWAYTEGLCWVMKYYYQGCASWTWYFPYHYAPFASDFDTISDYKVDFSVATKPFKPLEQLMGVFPAASRAHIPEGWRALMTDEKSPIYHFYPTDFEIDLNGKKFAWQGVALLPFVDEQRLLEALKEVYGTLTPDEIRRNCSGHDRLFVGKQHEAFPAIQEVHDSNKDAEKEENFDENGKLIREWVYLDGKSTHGMAGEIAYDKDAVAIGASYPTLFSNSLEYRDIKDNACAMVAFRDPQFPESYIFKAERLSGIKELERVLKPGDWDERRSGHFTPQIGFTRNIPRANLSNSGHRALNHSIQGQRNMLPTKF